MKERLANNNNNNKGRRDLQMDKGEQAGLGFVCTVDELHSSLCVYFRIISRWSRDRATCHWGHMTYPDCSWSLPTISDDICFWPTSHAHCEPQFGTTQQKFYGSVKKLLRTLAYQYIKIVRPRQHITLAQHQPGNLKILWSSCDSWTGVMSQIW